MTDRPEVQEADGAGPRGTVDGPKLSPYVRVLNAVWNGSGFIKRKAADHYVAEKRGVFVNDQLSQLRLDMTHPANLAAANRAGIGYLNADLEFEWRRGRSGGATVMVTESRTRWGKSR